MSAEDEIYCRAEFPLKILREVMAHLGVGGELAIQSFIHQLLMQFSRREIGEILLSSHYGSFNLRFGGINPACEVWELLVRGDDADESQAREYLSQGYVYGPFSSLRHSCDDCSFGVRGVRGPNLTVAFTMSRSALVASSQQYIPEPIG